MLPLVFWRHCRVYPLTVFIFLVTCLAPVPCSRATAQLVFNLLGPPCCSDPRKAVFCHVRAVSHFSELAWRRHLALTACFPTLHELASRETFLRGQTCSSRDLLTFQDVVATGRYIQRHLFNGPAKRARCHILAKTADTIEHTLLHPKARTQQEFTHSRGQQSRCNDDGQTESP